LFSPADDSLPRELHSCDLQRYKDTTAPALGFAARGDCLALIPQRTQTGCDGQKFSEPPILLAAPGGNLPVARLTPFELESFVEQACRYQCPQCQ
jgi:hypothetical protein